METIQEIAYPFAYTAPAEIPKYTSTAIRKIAEATKKDPSFNASNYKECPALTMTYQELFAVWWAVWGDERISYPEEGCIYGTVQEVCGDAACEMFEASAKRFIGIAEKLVWNIYDNSTLPSAEEVRRELEAKWDRAEDEAEEEQRAAYEDL